MGTYLKTTINKINFNLSVYDATPAMRETLGEFTLPQWSISAFNSNREAKAQFNLSENETYDELTETQKQDLKKKVFNDWAHGIWELIRTRIGYRLDVYEYDRLSPQSQDQLRLAISYQINHWRINLPWEIDATATKTSGAISTTINATDYLTGYDALSARTRTAIINSGISKLSLEGLLKKAYREDILLTELIQLQKRVSELENNPNPEITTTGFISKTEAANTYWTRTTDLLSKTEADNLYITEDDLKRASGAYFTNEALSTNSIFTKEIINNNNEKLVEKRAGNYWSVELHKEGTTSHILELNEDGLRIDNASIPSEATILQNISRNYLTINDASTTYQLKGNYITSIPNNLINETELNSFTYNKAAIDAKIAAAASGGQVDLSNYLTSAEINNDFVNKTAPDKQIMNADLAVPHIELSEEPVPYSNQAATTNYVFTFIKQLLIAGVSEYNKTAITTIGNKNINEKFNFSTNDEEIIFTVSNTQKIINIGNIEINNNIQIHRNSYTQQDSSGNYQLIDQKVFINKEAEKTLFFTTTTTTTTTGQSAGAPSGTNITSIQNIILRKDSIRAFIDAINSLRS